MFRISGWLISNPMTCAKIQINSIRDTTVSNEAFGSDFLYLGKFLNITMLFSMDLLKARNNEAFRLSCRGST